MTVPQRVSVVIPSRGEQFLNRTIEDVLANAAGDVEVIATLDGYWPDPILGDERIRYVHRGFPRGMRAGINAAVAVSTGEFLLKTDGHCSFGPGWDEILKADCDDDWIVTPRRDRLDAEKWCLQDTGKAPIDYMYLSYPDDPNDWGGAGLNGKVWDAKNRDESLRSVLIDDLMSAQGSAWFMRRPYFDYLELMDDVSYGTFWNEAQELFLKAWLSGGRCVVNKNTYYLHLHKGKTYGRGYRLSNKTLEHGAAYTRKWFMEPTGSAWHKAHLPLAWLIEHFWPVPGWPDDRALWGQP